MSWDKLHSKHKVEDDFTGKLHLNNNMIYIIQNTYIKSTCKHYGN